MGSGIAQAAALKGIKVILNDLNMGILEQGLTTVEVSLKKQFEADHSAVSEVSAIVKNIRLTDDIEQAKKADFVIEAASEQLTLKRNLFEQLAQVTPDHVVLATNSSSLSITELGNAVPCPERVIGMHFMNPVSKMKLVEVIRGMHTSKHSSLQTVEFAKFLGKEPIVVNDYPGFVSNRILMPMINEAIFCVYEGVAEVESVDRIMQLGMNHPIGPLALADLIGLDICLSVMRILHHGFGDDKYRPCPLLVKMVKGGQLGKKSGQGFYSYG